MADRQINTYRTGDYFGELPLLLGAPAIASVRALEPSRVAQLDRSDFADLYTACKHFSAELTDTMTKRFTRLRTLAEETPPTRVTIVGHRFDIACHQLRDFLVRNRILFRWLDPTRPSLGGEIEPPQPGDTYPMVVLPDGHRLVTPTLRELADRLGLQTAPRNAVYDLAIIGGGPAGLAAAVYGASRSTMMLLSPSDAP